MNDQDIEETKFEEIDKPDPEAKDQFDKDMDNIRDLQKEQDLNANPQIQEEVAPEDKEEREAMKKEQLQRQAYYDHGNINNRVKMHTYNTNKRSNFDYREQNMESEEEK